MPSVPIAIIKDCGAVCAAPARSLRGARRAPNKAKWIAGRALLNALLTAYLLLIYRLMMHCPAVTLSGTAAGALLWLLFATPGCVLLLALGRIDPPWWSDADNDDSSPKT
jgi:hypothetical protein